MLGVCFTNTHAEFFVLLLLLFLFFKEITRHFTPSQQVRLYEGEDLKKRKKRRQQKGDKVTLSCRLHKERLC